MPVSKKRKKLGKTVQRRSAAKPASQESQEAGHPAPDHPGIPDTRAGQPRNPFVAMQQHRGAQRGR